VTVIYNNGSALIGATAEVWNQASAGIPGAPNLGDSFGAALTAGRYDAGSAADLVVGIPSKDVVPGGGGAAVVSAGMVDVIYGASTGLSSTGAQGWTVESPGVPRNARLTDNFGEALR